MAMKAPISAKKAPAITGTVVTFWMAGGSSWPTFQKAYPGNIYPMPVPNIVKGSKVGAIYGGPLGSNAAVTQPATSSIVNKGGYFQVFVPTGTANPPSPWYGVRSALPLHDGTQGVSYSEQFKGVGGVSPYTFSVTAGSLPGGLSLSSAGLISGTPTSVGSFTFSITITDTNGNTGTQQFTLVISSPTTGVSAPVWGSWVFCTGYVGQAYSHSWDMENVSTPVTYSVSAGSSLPPGLSLTSSGSSGGTLSGTPTTAGTYTFSLDATNAYGTVTQSFTMTISYPSSETSYTFAV